MQAFMVSSETGCSCCASDNHWCGPFSSREIAETYQQQFILSRRCASQYAPYGIHRVHEFSAEVLEDGRIIIHDRVFPGWASGDPEPIEKDFFSIL
jgi:hypothetical protein